jgi:hypothetical protein
VHLNRKIRERRPILLSCIRFAKKLEILKYTSHAVAQLVEALLYKPEGHGLVS